MILNKLIELTETILFKQKDVCQIHGEKMKPQKVLIKYGLYTRTGKTRNLAYPYLFPNRIRPVKGGCVVSSKSKWCTTILYCQNCEDNYRKWIDLDRGAQKEMLLEVVTDPKLVAEVEEFYKEHSNNPLSPFAHEDKQLKDSLKKHSSQDEERAAKERREYFGITEEDEKDVYTGW